jgi:hypothetical protein
VFPILLAVMVRACDGEPTAASSCRTNMPCRRDACATARNTHRAAAPCNVQHTARKMQDGIERRSACVRACVRACARACALRVLLLLAGIAQRALYECFCHLLPMPTARRLRAVPRPSAEPSQALNHGEAESEGRCEHAQGAFKVCVHCYRHTAAVGLHGPDLPVANGSVQPSRVESPLGVSLRLRKASQCRGQCWP